MPVLSHAACSIVILAHNGCRFTRYCLESLLLSQPLPAQLLIADNGSTDETPELLREFMPKFNAVGIDFITWRNAENKGCSEARNDAWARATQPYVVFLDNDTAVGTQNWLEILQSRMDADPQLGILGPKLIYPYQPHPIQCAGVMLSPLGRVRFIGRGEPRHSPEQEQFRRCTALISACWIMRREFLEQLGGLDPLFHPVQFEDLDYCIRVRRAGYYCACEPRAELYHFEGITTASFGEESYSRTIVINSARFRRKWRDYLKTLPPDPADYRWRQRSELGLDPKLICDLSILPPSSLHD